MRARHNTLTRLLFVVVMVALGACGAEEPTSGGASDASVGTVPRDTLALAPDGAGGKADGPERAEDGALPSGDADGRSDAAVLPADGDAAESPDAPLSVDAADPPDASALPPDAAEPPPPPPVECMAWADLHDQPLVEVLHEALHDTYRPIDALPDFGGTPNRYTTARRLMFLEVDDEPGPDGSIGVECVYTGLFFPMEPGVEPDDDVVNVEHVRPRSTLDADRMSLLYSHEESDLHHLYPSLPGANSSRGSLPFGDVTALTNNEFLPARLGTDDAGHIVFEPRPERKGDIARAMLYMTVRWGLELQEFEEAALKRWDLADPVDAREATRNDAVEAIQGNRNPFVDCPGLARNIADFMIFPPLDSNASLPAP